MIENLAPQEFHLEELCILKSEYLTNKTYT